MFTQSPAACPEELKKISYESSLVLDIPNNGDGFAIVSFKLIS
jgi:hypothetical protein